MRPLTPNEVYRGLKTKSFGRPTVCFEKVGSSNDVAFQLAGEGISEGLVVTAESQTQGRGRRGRKWNTSPGQSLAFSLLLRPKLRPQEEGAITLAAAVAVAKTLESFRVKPKIKWPNDVLLGGKKICGILTERGPGKDKIAPVVLGIGVNLNQAAGDFPKEIRGIATSYYRHRGRKIDRAVFLRKLLLDLEEIYGWVRKGKIPKVLDEWRRRSFTLGRQVRVVSQAGVLFGQAVDLSEEGALLIRNELGMTEKVVAGDVEVLSLRSYPPRKKRVQ